MEKLEFGETFTLENNKEYTVFNVLSDNGNDYVYLISTSKPIEILIAREIIKENGIDLAIITKEEEKLRLLELFKKNNQGGKKNG